MSSRGFIERKAAVMSRALEELAPGYEVRDGRNPIAGCCELPSETEVIGVLALLDDVFYPGYRADCRGEDAIETLVIERLDEAYDILFRQVKRALPVRWKSEYARAGGKPIRELKNGELDAEAER